MKIRLSKMRGRVTSIKFEAGDGEGVDLRDAVLAMGKAEGTPGVMRAIETLRERGYRGALAKETANAKEFRVWKEGAE